MVCVFNLTYFQVVQLSLLLIVMTLHIFLSCGGMIQNYVCDVDFVLTYIVHDNVYCMCG